MSSIFIYKSGMWHSLVTAISNRPAFLQTCNMFTHKTAKMPFCQPQIQHT